VKDTKNKWLTNSSFWHPKKKKLNKSLGGEDMSSSPLVSLFEFLNKQSPEVASRMAVRGLIWSPERHRWIRKPDVATQAILPRSSYAQQGFGSIGAPVEPEKPKSTPKGARLTALEALGDKLSPWEKDFLASVKQQLEKRGDLSDRQWETIDKIEAKFKQQSDIESGAVKASPLPPTLKKLEKLKKYMTENHVKALESMGNQVKAGGTLSPKQEDYLEIIEANAKKQKKALTEPATGNIIIRPTTNKFDLDRWSSSSFSSLIEVSGKGAFHPKGRKWLEDNGFKWAGPMSGKMYLPITTEDKHAFMEEAGKQIKGGEELHEKVKELIQKRINDVMETMPDLRNMGFSLKRPDPESKRGYKDTPKVWKMLFGRK
jgi:hypothetical protein